MLESVILINVLTRMNLEHVKINLIRIGQLSGDPARTQRSIPLSS